MQCIKEKYLVHCTYLVVRILVQTKMTLSESPCRLSFKLSEKGYGAVSDIETLFISIYSVGNNNINSVITSLKITGQAAKMIKHQEACECNES